MELGIGSKVRVNIDFDVTGSGLVGEVTDITSLNPDGTPEKVHVVYDEHKEERDGEYFVDILDVLTEGVKEDD